MQYARRNPAGVFFLAQGFRVSQKVGVDPIESFGTSRYV